MATSLTLGFDPIWSNFNLFGVSAGGASLYSYDSLNPTVQKFIFSDPGGQYPYTDPILFDANGNAPGLFYFVFDPLNPKSLYDLFLYDSQGNLIWNAKNYFPGGTGGSDVTTNVNLNNLIVNPVFWRNIGGGAGSSPSPIPITTAMTYIAPGAHDALSFNVSPMGTSATSNAFGPDIWFIRNLNTANDSVTFTPFILGSTPFTDDVTPIEYVNFQTTNSVTGETFKYFQIPVNAKIQNLTNQTVTFKIWAQAVTPGATILIELAQFYGDGAGATPTNIFPVMTFNLTTSWAPYVVSFTFPNVSGNSIGPCGNDGIFILIGMPLNQPTNLNFQKPSLYLGNIQPQADFINYDVIDAAINSPRTGDTRVTLSPFGRGLASNGSSGWVPMNDGSIGSNSSGATTRAKTDTFPLYNLIWNSVAQAYAPMQDKLARGASAIIDFTANRAMYLTKSLGRVFAGTTVPNISNPILGVSGTMMNITSTVGFNPGDPVIFTTTSTLPAPLQLNTVYYILTIASSTNITLSISPGGAPITFTTFTAGSTITMPPYILGETVGIEVSYSVAQHTHDVPSGVGADAYLLVGPGSVELQSEPGSFNFLPSSTTGLVTGGPTASPIMQPTTYMLVYMKL